MTIDRRQFVKLTFVVTSAAVTGVAGALVAACSSDETPKSPTPGGSDAATKADSSTPVAEAGTDSATPVDSGGGGVMCKASISQNHGHSIMIPIADLDSTSTKTYSIKGTSAHSHNVVLDSTDLATLKAGQSVKKTSDMNGETHDHEVNILCV